MNARVSVTLAAFALFGCLAAAPSQRWAAMSTTAMGITGDIAIAPTSLAMAGHRFALTHARVLAAAALKAASGAVSVDSATSATVYAIAVPHGTTLLRGNTVCAPSTDARWLLVVRSAATLGLAFYSGASQPFVAAGDAGTGSNLCGTFTYARP